MAGSELVHSEAGRQQSPHPATKRVRRHWQNSRTAFVKNAVGDESSSTSLISWPKVPQRITKSSKRRKRLNQLLLQLLCLIVALFNAPWGQLRIRRFRC